MQWKNAEKTLDEEGDKLADNDRAFGHWPLLCNDLGVCNGRKRQIFNKWTYNLCHDSSECVFNTDCNEMRHISKSNVVRERWIFINQIYPLVCDVPTTFFTVVLKNQVPNDLKSKQKTWERPPMKRWESGLLRLYIAPVTAYLRWYDTYNVYRRQTWTREYARNQKTAIQMVDI